MAPTSLLGLAIQCEACVHHRADTLTCEAFPKRIPDAILSADYDHRHPYPGDHGVQFEVKPGRDPEEVAAAMDDIFKEP